MKYICILCMMFLLSCTNNDNILNGDIGKNGTDIISFGLSDGVNYYNAFLIKDTTIFINVKNQGDFKKLKANYSHNGKRVLVNGIEQISGESINDFSNFAKPLKYVVQSLDGKEKNYSVNLFDIPVVYLQTKNKQPITNKVDWIPSTIKIIDTDGNVLLDDEVYIKGRGNTSWTFEKKCKLSILTYCA